MVLIVFQSGIRLLLLLVAVVEGGVDDCTPVTRRFLDINLRASGRLLLLLQLNVCARVRSASPRL